MTKNIRIVKNFQRKSKRKFSTATRNQLLRAEKGLREAGSDGMTTIQLRDQLDIPMLAPRIWALRHIFGLNIQLIWTVGVNAQGNEYKVGKYVLQPGKWQEAA
jgi:hypothetical protein